MQQVLYFKMLNGAREMAQSLGATYFSCGEPVFGSKCSHMAAYKYLKLPFQMI